MLDGNSRQNLATFCQTWEEPEVHSLMDLAINKNMIDRDEYPQTAEIERRGHPHGGRPLECPRFGQHRRVLGDRLVRGLHDGRAGGEVALAGEASCRRPPHGLAEHGLRTGAGGLAQVREVLGHRDARGPDVARALLHGRRRHAGPGRREHHLRGADPRGHLHRRVRAGEADRRGARSTAGRDRARRRHPRRRGQRRFPGPVLRSGPRVGLPPSRGSSRSARRATSSGWPRSVSAGWSGATRRSCPTTSSST